MTSSHHMINERAVFSSLVKRLFSGTVHELIGELLQNSQRAGASRVDIRFPDPSHCVFADDGHGLLPGLEGLRRLLVLADTIYLDRQVAIDQNPMGVGLYALIAHERIRELCIQSNGLSIAIDTWRWLNDHAYCESWEERVCVEMPEEHGFRITIKGTLQFMEDVRACLLDQTCMGYSINRYEWVRHAMSPVCGYENVLTITLDGIPLTLPLPSYLSLPEAEIEDYYEGNMVRISPFCPGEAGVCVNWYGQVVVDERFSLRCQAYLVVRSGQPVHPLAPTRNGLIQDQALEDFYRWVKDRVFAWACALEPPSVEIVERLYSIDPMRAERECPFAVVKQWLPLPRDYTFVSHEVYSGEAVFEEDHRYGREMVVHKAELSKLVLLGEEVVVPLQGDHPAQYYSLQRDPIRASEIATRNFNLGLNSLLRATGLTAYSPVIGAVPAYWLWWRPGKMTDNWHTIDLGVWGLGTSRQIVVDGAVIDEDIPPETWQPLTEGWIFVVSDTAGWNIRDATWIIGLDNSDDMVPFLRACGYAAFVHDESDDDGSAESYDRSVGALIREYLLDTIAYDTGINALCAEVQLLLPEGYQAHEADWRFVTGESRFSSRRSLTYLLLTFPDGYCKKVNLI